MRKLTFYFLVLGLVLLGVSRADATFIVDWGDSIDPGDGKGYTFIGNWLYSNGYFSDETAASNFAKDDYIGSLASDADPFYFANGLYNVRIVYENARYADINTLGWYSDSVMSEIFSGPDGESSGFRTIGPTEDFGFYIRSGYPGEPYWYTDRFKNTSQSGTRLSVNNPQGLIYELKPGSEWLIAWEDLDSTNLELYTDNDYNDMFVVVTTVPEPASLSVLGLSLAGLLVQFSIKYKRGAV